jgi:hypothetical protein
MASNTNYKRNKLESIVIRKMDISPDASSIVKEMSLNELQKLVKELEGWGNKSGGKVTKKRGGTVSRKKGSKIMQGYKAGGKV